MDLNEPQASLNQPLDESGWTLKLLLLRLDSFDSTAAPDVQTFASTEDPANLLELLTCPQPSIDKLRLVKSQLKSRRKTQESPHRRAAVALYYTVIAKALLTGEAQFTDLDRISLLEGIVWTMNRDWLPSEVREIVANAFVLLNDQD